MKPHLFLLIVVAAALSGCNRGSELERDQQQYEVIQEGAAGAVTSTIHAPGEVMPPLTGTNADTTTAFTLPTTTDTTMQTAPPGSLAETFPTTPSYPTETRRTPPRPAPEPVPPRSYEPEPQPQPEPVPQPVPQPLPPPTTTTTQPPAEEPAEEEPEPEPQPAPEPEPQPPPPPTDTAP